MDILYVLDEFPKLSEAFVLNEIAELEHRGHDVAVFALRNPDEAAVHEVYEELDAAVRYFETAGLTDLPDLFSRDILDPGVLKDATFAASPRGHALVLHQSKQCIDFVDGLDFDVDLVHAHFATLRRYSGRYVASHYDVPFTVTAHAFDLYRAPNESQLAHILRTADHVVTVSEYNRAYIEREVTDATPVSVVHAGVRPETFERRSEPVPTRVLTVARFIEKKGLPDALEAVSRVVDRFPDLEYHVVGSGEQRAEIEARIEALDLSETVELLGTVTDERLRVEFDEAACFLLPCVVAESGDRDGIPVALVESMATETPPVSTSVSGIPELVDHRENGLLVEPGDVSGIATAVSSLLADPDDRRRLGRAGREKVKGEFDVSREVAKLEAVFARTVDRY